MRNWLAGLVLFAAMAPVAAQELSPEADEAMWCLTAVNLLDVLGAYSGDGTQIDLLRDVWTTVALYELDLDGVTEDEMDGLIESYTAELEMQLPDYLVTSDPSALRHDIDVCLDG